MILSAENLDLIVYDFDGVMTDNRVLVMQDGSEAVFANRADGLGINHIREMGINQIILSTETNPVVQARAKKIKIDTISGCQDKKEALLEYCSNKGVDLYRVAFVGNDINDLEVMKIVGFKIAPKDAVKEILDISEYVTNAKGGEGVVKEIAYALIKQ
jgi:YrbI family 3-deoxy-D-manno-octulosonate 8-phosphate phosphatase